MRKLTITLFATALALAACSTSEPDEGADATTPADTATADTVAEDTVPDATEPVDTTAATTADTTADTAAETTVPDTEAPAATFPPVEDDRAPGVTDTSVKVGVDVPRPLVSRPDPWDQPG